MNPPERIETERLILRKPRIDDAPAVFTGWTQDTEVTRYLTWLPHERVEQTEEFIRGCLSAWDGTVRFPYIITLMEDDTPIGMIDPRIEDHKVGIGYGMARSYQGHGYMTEATRHHCLGISTARDLSCLRHNRRGKSRVPTCAGEGGHGTGRLVTEIHCPPEYQRCAERQLHLCDCKMKFDPQKHHRRSIRLKKYDYSQPGGYFITIVTFQREFWFGEIVNGEMVLNDCGRVADECWRAISEHFPNVELGAYVVMPNHVHGIITIHDERRGEVLSPHNDPTENSGGETPPLRQPTLGQIVAYFKYQSTKQMNRLDNSGVITKFWQRNYYEHVICNHEEWDRIQRYIESNPSNWMEDDENPFK